MGGRTRRPREETPPAEQEPDPDDFEDSNDENAPGPSNPRKKVRRNKEKGPAEEDDESENITVPAAELRKVLAAQVQNGKEISKQVSKLAASVRQVGERVSGLELAKTRAEIDDNEPLDEARRVRLTNQVKSECDAKFGRYATTALIKAARVYAIEQAPFQPSLFVGPATPETEKAKIEAYRQAICSAFAGAKGTTLTAMEEAELTVPEIAFRLFDLKISEERRNDLTQVRGYLSSADSPWPLPAIDDDADDEEGQLAARRAYVDGLLLDNKCLIGPRSEPLESAGLAKVLKFVFINEQGSGRLKDVKKGTKNFTLNTIAYGATLVLYQLRQWATPDPDIPTSSLNCTYWISIYNALVAAWEAKEPAAQEALREKVTQKARGQVGSKARAALNPPRDMNAVIRGLS